MSISVGHPEFKHWLIYLSIILEETHGLENCPALCLYKPLALIFMSYFLSYITIQNRFFFQWLCKKNQMYWFLFFYVFYRLQQKLAQYFKSAHSSLYIYAWVLKILFHFCGAYDLFQLTALFCHHDRVFRVVCSTVPWQDILKCTLYSLGKSA